MSWSLGLVLDPPLWIENLLGVLHGMQWISFHGLPDFETGPPHSNFLGH